MGRRTLGTLAAALVVAAGVPLVGATPAHAAAYRFWSYWHGGADGWAYSGVGAGSWPLVDGAVEGWRFAVSPGTASAPRPRLDPGSVWALPACAGTSAGAGQIRAAIVIDFGQPSDYADGQTPPADPVRVWCGVLPKGSRGMALLNAATDGVLRTEAGMICGISGYPSRGCGEVVADPTPTRTSTPKPRPTATAKPHPSSPAPERTTPHSSPPPTTARPTGEQSPADGRPSRPPATQPPGTVSPPTGSPTPAVTDPVGAAADVASPTPVVGLPVSGDASAAGTPWPVVLVAVVLAALAGTAYWRRRPR